MLAFLISVAPSAGVLFFFWVGIRALLQADRRERAAELRLTQQRPPVGPARADDQPAAAPDDSLPDRG